MIKEIFEIDSKKITRVVIDSFILYSCIVLINNIYLDFLLGSLVFIYAACLTFIYYMCKKYPKEIDIFKQPLKITESAFYFALIVKLILIGAAIYFGAFNAAIFYISAIVCAWIDMKMYKNIFKGE